MTTALPFFLKHFVWFGCVFVIGGASFGFSDLTQAIAHSGQGLHKLLFQFAQLVNNILIRVGNNFFSLAMGFSLDFLGAFLNNKLRWTGTARSTSLVFLFRPSLRALVIECYYFRAKPAIKTLLRRLARRPPPPAAPVL